MKNSSLHDIGSAEDYDTRQDRCVVDEHLGPHVRAVNGDCESEGET